MAAIGATLALAFAAVGAGYSLSRVAFILIFTLVASFSALYTYRAYLAWQRHQFSTRSLPWVIACTAAAVLLVAAFISRPFGSKTATAGNQRSYAMPVTPAMAAAPLMYGVRSTDTVAGDNTAVAHQIFAGGWMQQVFLATGTQLVNASGAHTLGTASAVYDGSTNNAELHAVFPKPIPLKRGSVYALRVVNESGLSDPPPARTTPETADRRRFPFSTTTTRIRCSPALFLPVPLSGD